MFERNGANVQAIAKIVFIVGMVLAVFFGIVVPVAFWREDAVAVQIIVGLLVAIVVAIYFFVISIFIAAFGELVETNAQMRDIIFDKMLDDND